MKEPPHIGGFIRRQVVEPSGLSMTDAAQALGVTQQARKREAGKKVRRVRRAA